METATIVLTREQKAEIAAKMGVISDEIVLSSISNSIKAAKIEDLGDNLFIAAGKTYTVS